MGKGKNNQKGREREREREKRGRNIKKKLCTVLQVDEESCEREGALGI